MSATQNGKVPSTSDDDIIFDGQTMAVAGSMGLVLGPKEGGRILARRVVIRNCRFVNCRGAIAITNEGWIGQLVIEDCFFANISEKAIDVRCKYGEAVISGNTFNRIGRRAIELMRGGCEADGEGSNATIENNTIQVVGEGSTEAYGIHVHGTRHVIRGNRLFDICASEDSTGTHSYGIRAGLHNSIIADNIMDNVALQGGRMIDVRRLEGQVDQSVICSGNVLKGNPDGKTANGIAICCPGVLCSNNYLDGARIFTGEAAQNVTITGNALKNLNRIGIKVNARGSNYAVTGNTFSNISTNALGLSCYKTKDGKDSRYIVIRDNIVLADEEWTEVWRDRENYHRDRGLVSTSPNG